jgi:hypothetical protein
MSNMQWYWEFIKYFMAVAYRESALKRSLTTVLRGEGDVFEI